MHLFIELLFESQASLNKRAVQLLAWLGIFVSARSKLWPVSTQFEAIRDAFTLQLLNPCGEPPRSLSCVVTGTLLALGSVDDR